MSVCCVMVCNVRVWCECENVRCEGVWCEGVLCE